MCELAKTRGIRLCHENESRIYGQMPAEVNDIITNVPDLYAIFDPANYRMNNADVFEGIEATKLRLGYLHIKDAIYSTQTIIPAGEGEGKIAEVGYDSAFDFERIKSLKKVSAMRKHCHQRKNMQMRFVVGRTNQKEVPRPFPVRCTEEYRPFATPIGNESILEKIRVVKARMQKRNALADGG